LPDKYVGATLGTAVGEFDGVEVGTGVAWPTKKVGVKEGANVGRVEGFLDGGGVV